MKSEIAHSKNSEGYSKLLALFAMRFCDTLILLDSDDGCQIIQNFISQVISRGYTGDPAEVLCFSDLHDHTVCDDIYMPLVWYRMMEGIRMQQKLYSSERAWGEGVKEFWRLDSLRKTLSELEHHKN